MRGPFDHRDRSKRVAAKIIAGCIVLVAGLLIASLIDGRFASLLFVLK